MSGTLSEPLQERAGDGVAGDERLISLDVIRGLAIFGILMVHATLMGQLDPFREPGWTGALSRVLVSGLFELKFFATFSMLFGAGFLLQAQRADQNGRAFGRLFIRRMLVLAGFGVLHGVFLFPGDVLLLYGVVGLLLYPLRRCQARTLATLGVLLTLIPAGLSYLDMDSGTPPALDPERAVTDLSFTEIWIHAAEEGEAWQRITTVARGEGPYGLTIQLRTAEFLTWLFLCAVFFFWRVIGLFFLGAALMKWRFFHREQVGLQRDLLAVGLKIGLPLEVAYGIANGIWSLDTGSSLAFQIAFSVHVLSSILLALGLMAGLILAVHSGAARRAFLGLAAVGRMALTAYVSQSLLACLLMDWYGLGWFDRFGTLALLGAVPVVFLAQVVLCSLWLQWFRMGPLEWLWRTATYLRWQPLLRR